MKKLTKAKLSMNVETIRTLNTRDELRAARGGDSAEPGGSVDHNICYSVGCPKPKWSALASAD